MGGGEQWCSATARSNVPVMLDRLAGCKWPPRTPGGWLLELLAGQLLRRRLSAPPPGPSWPPVCYCCFPAAAVRPQSPPT